MAWRTGGLAILSLVLGCGGPSTPSPDDIEAHIPDAAAVATEDGDETDDAWIQADDAPIRFDSFRVGYRSAGLLSAEVRDRVVRDAASLDHDFWYEGILWLPAGSAPSMLEGDTKLGPHGDRGIDPLDEVLLAWQDAEFVTRQVERWSTLTGQDWFVSVGGAAGRVSAGKRSARVQRILDTLRGERFATADAAEAKCAELRKAFAATRPP